MTIFTISTMHFSPLKLRNEDLNVHYCSWKSFLQRETWLNVIFILVTNVVSIVHLTVKITGCIQTIQWFEVRQLALCMASLDLYSYTIRLGPDPNRMGYNSRGSFLTPCSMPVFAPQIFPAYLIAVLATANGRFTAVITESQMDKSCLNFHPACKLQVN